VLSYLPCPKGMCPCSAEGAPTHDVRNLRREYRPIHAFTCPGPSPAQLSITWEKRALDKGSFRVIGAGEGDAPRRRYRAHAGVRWTVFSHWRSRAVSTQFSQP
jgi:hypothetical protein